MLLSLLVASGCGRGGSSGTPGATPPGSQSTSGPHPSTPSRVPFEPPGGGLKLSTLPSEQGGGGHQDPATVVRGTVAWRFQPDLSFPRQAYIECPYCAFDNRAFALQRHDRAPMRVTIRLAGRGFVLADGRTILPIPSNAYYCQNVECDFYIDFVPDGPGHFAGTLTVDGGDIHARYKVLGFAPKASAFPEGAPTGRPSPEPSASRSSSNPGPSPSRTPVSPSTSASPSETPTG